jgi:hypothetical protein
MKRITLLIAFLTITITCFGQKIEINGFGTTSLSHTSVELSSTQIAGFGKNKLRNNIPSPGFFAGNAKVYSVGNVLVSVRYKSLKKTADPDNYLTTIKKSLDPFFSDSPGYTSKIETIGGKKFLITSQPLNGNITKAFYGVNNSTLTSLQGSVQCTPEDEAEANATLRELLTNLKYKVQ